MATIILEMPEIEPKQLGGFIAYLRGRAGLSQQKLAAQIGIDESGLSRRESGNRQWKWSELERTAKALGVGSADNMISLAAEWSDRGVPVLGTVPASTVTRHWQFVDDIEHAHEFIPRKGQPRDTYALRVHGDSMEPVIPDGTYIYCRAVPPDADSIPSDCEVVATFSEDAPHPGVCLGYFIVRSMDEAEIVKTDPRRYPSIRIDLNADPPHLIGLSVVVGKFRHDEEAHAIVEEARRKPRWEVSRILDPELTPPPGEKSSDKQRARKKPSTGTEN